MGEPTVYKRAMDYEKKKKRDQIQGRRAKKKQYGRCNAATRAGGRCQQAKGYGTTHPGVGYCKYHGGRATSHALNAAKQQAVLMGAPLDINPVDALYWCIKITAGEVKFLSEQIAKVEKKDWYESTVLGKQMHILVRERKEATTRLAQFSKDALALGLAERAVRLAENYGAAISRLLTGVLGELDLTREQQEIAPVAIRKHLLAMEGASVINASDRELLALPQGAIIDANTRTRVSR